MYIFHRLRNQQWLQWLVVCTPFPGNEAVTATMITLSAPLHLCVLNRIRKTPKRKNMGFSERILKFAASGHKEPALTSQAPVEDGRLRREHGK